MIFSESVNMAYNQKQGSLVLALTGRTGSGCSTVASILKRESISELGLKQPKTHEFENVDERKYEIVYRYLTTQYTWKPFTIIEGSSIILSYVIAEGLGEFKRYLAKYRNKDKDNDTTISGYRELMNIVDGLNYLFEDVPQYDINNLNGYINNREAIKELYTYFTIELPKRKRKLYSILLDYTCQKEKTTKEGCTILEKSQLYTFLMQCIGNNIRCSGKPYEHEYTQKNFYDVAKRVDVIIQVITKHNENNGNNYTRICIDAIRNPYEAFFFKDKYSYFMLVSINTDEDERRRRLAHLDADELASLDAIEYQDSFSNEGELFYHQNIPDCLEISDIHIYNPRQTDRGYYFLTEQIAKYICLILKPGLVTPTALERCMQLAYMAKLNSGCLSRQVGAIITDSEHSVKAIGWNDVPKGQVPCNLRDVRSFLINKDSESFSEYEIEDTDFNRVMSKIKLQVTGSEGTLCGRSYPYCFKDVYNGLKKKDNQVYTRSLHAEENAFLQITRNGGQGIKGGILYTTASPCELCAKKAYQLGIKHIYYIDPYPGISMRHILKFGNSNNPIMHLFYGAIGKAYVELYTQRIPVKDELRLLSGIDIKTITSSSACLDSLKASDIKYSMQRIDLVFETRENIYVIETSEVIALHDGINSIPQGVMWTGSSFGCITLEGQSDGYELVVFDPTSPSYGASLKFQNPLKKDETKRYAIKTTVNDNKHIMSPYYSLTVTNKTDHLQISIRTKENELSCVKGVIYAGKDTNPEFIVETHDLEGAIDGEFCEYRFVVDEPVRLTVISNNQAKSSRVSKGRFPRFR